MRRVLALICCLALLGPLSALAQGREEPGVKAGKQMEILTAPPDPKDVPVTGGKRRVPLKLLDTIRLGMTDNIEVKKGILDRATSVENLLLAERIFEPEFNITGGYAYNAGSDQDNRNLGVEVTKRLETAGRLSFSWNQANILDRNAGSTDNQATLSAKLTQPLLRGAGITVGTAEVVQAQYSEAQEFQSFRSLLMGKLTEIQAAYWDLLLALENRLSAIRALEASRNQLKKNKMLIQAGRMPAADLVQTEQEVARNEVNLLNQDLAVENANRTLVNLLDLNETIVILPIEGFIFRAVKVDYQALADQAFKTNTNILTQQISVKNAKLNLKLAESNALDEVNLEIGTSQTGSGGSPGEALDEAKNLGSGWSGSVVFNIPLGLPRDRLQQQVTIAKRSLIKTKLDLHQASRNLRQSIRDRVNDVERNLRQIKIGQQSLNLAQRKYDIQLVKLELGKANNYQVLLFHRDLVSAADSLHGSIASYLKSLAQLDELVGTALATWNIQVVKPVPPHLPKLNLKGLEVPAPFK
ncbi:MAG: TolC family protein [Desulfarculaceae bacterium]|nr:TolC family protein [Desulfarculaceae bacterium]